MTIEKYTCFFIIASVILLTACSKKKEEDLRLPEMKPQPVAAVSPSIQKKDETPKYVYPHVSKRDPFIALITEGGAGGGTRIVDMESESGFINKKGEFVNLELRGILKDKKGKVAMIASTGGEAYMLKSGKIYDKRNRIIEGISGIIKEQSVILISQNKTVKELSLFKKEKTKTP